MKKILVLIAFISMTLCFSCKKGENDPFFSIYSRNNRISNSWKLTDVEGTYTTPGGNVNEAFSYSEKNLIISNLDGFVIQKQNYTLEMTIEKKGNYSYYEVYVNTDNVKIENIGSGKWKWVKIDKKKDAIQFEDYNSYLLDYYNKKTTKVYSIDRLAKNELVIKERYSFKLDNTSTTETTKDFTYTFKMR
jgi:hypothetical protein